MTLEGCSCLRHTSILKMGGKLSPKAPSLLKVHRYIMSTSDHTKPMAKEVARWVLWSQLSMPKTAANRVDWKYLKKILSFHCSHAKCSLEGKLTCNKHTGAVHWLKVRLGFLFHSSPSHPLLVGSSYTFKSKMRKAAVEPMLKCISLKKHVGMNWQEVGDLKNSAQHRSHSSIWMTVTTHFGLWISQNSQNSLNIHTHQTLRSMMGPWLHVNIASSTRSGARAWAAQHSSQH